MNAEDILAVETRFLNALVGSNTTLLREMLADDFIITDPVSGTAISKPALLDALDSRVLGFPVVKRDNPRVTLDNDRATVTGSAFMQMRLGADTISVSARYTHVYLQRADGIKVARAQATSAAHNVK